MSTLNISVNCQPPLFSHFRSKSQKPMAQAGCHLSDGCYCLGDHHHGVHFCGPAQAFTPKVQGMTKTLREIIIKDIRYVQIWLTNWSLDTRQYGIVLDAGSSHTSVFIYKWPAEKANNTGMVQQHHTCNVKGMWSLIYWP